MEPVKVDDVKVETNESKDSISEDHSGNDNINKTESDKCKENMSEDINSNNKNKVKSDEPKKDKVEFDYSKENIKDHNGSNMNKVESDESKENVPENHNGNDNKVTEEITKNHVIDSKDVEMKDETEVDKNINTLNSSDESTLSVKSDEPESSSGKVHNKDDSDTSSSDVTDAKGDTANNNNNNDTESESLNKSTHINPDLEQCDICGQFLNNSDIIYYQGHPQDAVEEFIALTNEKLILSAGNINV